MLEVKVRLPRDVAEALDYAREKLNWSHANILVRTCRRDWESPEMAPIDDFCTTDNKALVIAEALVNGYEIEETPEDKVREYYKDQIRYYNDHRDSTGQAILKILNILNIKIEGVNA